MRVFQPIDLKDVEQGPFTFDGNGWALLTAAKAPAMGESGQAVNTMTISWGGMTYKWNGKTLAAGTITIPFSIFQGTTRRACTVTYSTLPSGITLNTNEGIRAAKGDFLCFFDHEQFRREMKYLGMVSGRHEDKIAGARLTVSYDSGIPYFDEAKDVLLCHTLYRQAFTPEGFVDRSLRDSFYEKGDEHTMYIAEIRKVMIR